MGRRRPRVRVARPGRPGEPALRPDADAAPGRLPMRRDRSAPSGGRRRLLPALGCNRQPAPPAGAAAPAAPAGHRREARDAAGEARGRAARHRPGVRGDGPVRQAHRATSARSRTTRTRRTGPPHDRHIDIGSRVKRTRCSPSSPSPSWSRSAKQKEALVRQAEAEVEQAEKALARGRGRAWRRPRRMVTEAEAGVDRAQALYDRWQSEVNADREAGHRRGDRHARPATRRRTSSRPPRRPASEARREGGVGRRRR